MRVMKPTRHLLLVLCPMLVLGFLYYSSGRLHLRGWGQKSLYDKQGFLLKLGGHLPLELMYKYGNLSEGVCKPGYAAAKMTTIYPMFAKPAPMFLDPNFRRFSKISNFFPPFGIKTQEKIIDNILTATKSYGLGEELDSQSCKKCIIMGNGGILANKSMGVKIDEYDVIARLNEAPVSGYEKDVGSKTTMRITYPEGAIQKTERYEQDSLFVLSAFKALDFKWLRSIIFKERLNIPTLGTVAITMALHNCDEVAVAGFGYDMSTPHAPLHYYEKIRMAAIKESWTHNISKEKEFLIKLVKAGVIQDLTNGICGSGC
ncbi:CMP-N-acetylneuraminate-beta-1,4-galactoside alpha-2,3-sialyltransferase isoform X3 [Oncorhynchus tshawytscha]|uniref:CMP-N-acetylneuraminate-beta-1,4-galactoside alpha-2,3-sialyltransferase isoform X3 n=1 Tax=Oncorhynchus tshawytscha TaxID=74940 RepID=UPI000D09C346|nr:CMP-N-acetylneuraminate-beta-1,4-galactoside alpha-2,3-sialyltransferase isoform X3 [Oncorhynchus tshawytscha]